MELVQGLWRALSAISGTAYAQFLFQTLIAAATPPSLVKSPLREPTGRERVDRALAKTRQQFERAKYFEDFQSIGLLCREILTSLGQVVFDSQIHVTLDGISLSRTDAQRVREAFINAIVPGSTNETIRRHAKTALAFALDLQHRRTANSRKTASC